MYIVQKGNYKHRMNPPTHYFSYVIKVWPLNILCLCARTLMTNILQKLIEISFVHCATYIMAPALRILNQIGTLFRLRGSAFFSIFATKLRELQTNARNTTTHTQQQCHYYEWVREDREFYLQQRSSES